MKKLKVFFTVFGLLSSSVYAAKYEVKVTNLTKGQGWGLPIIISHRSNFKAFQSGMPASQELRSLAEDGDNKPLGNSFNSNRSVHNYVLGTSPLLPGKSMSFTIDSPVGAYLTVIGMLGTTNDTFAAVHEVPLKWTWTPYYGTAYDAGTEVNNESCDFIPGPPCGNPGVPQPEGSEGYVYVSNGINGVGDLDRATLNWYNPVIKVEVKRK